MKQSRSYISKPHILDQLFKLRQGAGSPHSGSFIQIKYTAFAKPKQQAIEEAKSAKEAGVCMHTYTGYVDKVWTTKDTGHLILTMLVFERLRKGKYTYRAFNLHKGNLSKLTIINP